MKELLVKSLKYKKMHQMFETKQEISIIAGPCSIESLEQLELIAQNLISNNVRFIRGGAFKPRTSPYDFQGLGIEGLKLLDYVRKKYNLLAVSEIMDPRDIEYGIKYTDIIQVGSRNMQNYSLLKELGKTNHPILLKRGMMSTIDEFLLAAEYIVANGNKNIILCERGIRTFEKLTRNTLDISCIAYIKQHTSLPIVVDISHSLGRKDIILPITQALIAMEVDGIMVEVHNDPQNALSDKNQQLSLFEFNDYCKSIDVFLNKEKKHNV